MSMGILSNYTRSEIFGSLAVRQNSYVSEYVAHGVRSYHRLLQGEQEFETIMVPDGPKTLAVHDFLMGLEQVPMVIMLHDSDDDNQSDAPIDYPTDDEDDDMPALEGDDGIDGDDIPELDSDDDMSAHVNLLLPQTSSSRTVLCPVCRGASSVMQTDRLPAVTGLHHPCPICLDSERPPSVFFPGCGHVACCAECYLQLTAGADH